MAGLGKIWPFGPSRARQDADRLVAAVTQISRQPDFYGEGRVADTLEGRLEMMTLMASLAFVRLRQEEGLAPLAQSFADTLFRSFDAGLREAGVGDTAVPKRMRRIASDFYGRLDAYSAALAAPDRPALEAAIARNMLGASAAPYAPMLADYVLAARARQAEAPAQSLFRLDGWGAAPG